MSCDGKESGEGDESNVGSPAHCSSCSLACLGAEMEPTLRPSSGCGEMSPVSRLATQARRWPGGGPGPGSWTWMPVERWFCRSAGLQQECTQGSGGCTGVPGTESAGFDDIPGTGQLDHGSKFINGMACTSDRGNECLPGCALAMTAPKANSTHPGALSRGTGAASEPLQCKQQGSLPSESMSAGVLRGRGACPLSETRASGCNEPCLCC